MKAYIDMAKHVLDKGVIRKNRTGVDTYAVFGYHYKIDLADGFPLLTTKSMYTDSIFRELMWYLSGETHIRNLRKHTKIWDGWTSEEKNWEVGKMYGYQWVNWEKHVIDENGKCTIVHINQIQNVIDMLKTNPDDRRMIVTAWNPSVLDEIALPSCHMFFMFSTIGGRLNCHMTQRSADLPLGVPFNIACYAALTQMIAQEVGMEVGEFSHYFNDLHIYENQVEGILEQIKREPRPLPTLKIAKKPFWDLRFEDFTIEGYHPYPKIKFPIAL